MEFLSWIERTGLATWVRESPSILAYPVILTLHTFGLAIVVGLNAAVDLRVLGCGGGMLLSPMRRFFNLMWLGFWINACTGVLLLAANATKELTNPIFLIKLTFIALAVVTMRVLSKKVFDDPKVDEKPVSQQGRLLAGVSLFFWAGAITAGRLVAYFNQKGAA